MSQTRFPPFRPVRLLFGCARVCVHPYFSPCPKTASGVPVSSLCPAMNNSPKPRLLAALAAILNLLLVAVAAALEPGPLHVPVLTPPEPGPAALSVLAPTVLELSRVIAKPADPARIVSWDFQDANGQLILPSPADFDVRVADRAIPVTRVGFKRRPLYAPLRTRDLRVGNWLYLELAAPIAPGETVQVQVTDARMAGASLILTAVAAPERPSAAIHVNQEGYVPDLPKVAWVGAFLGTLGELKLPDGTGFELVDEATGAVLFQGLLARRPDVGFSSSPLPYQEALVADFSPFTCPGRYRLRVPGVGVSDPFRIAEDIAALFARTYALGLYHQRCGTALELPWTRFTHDVCHRAPATVPTTNLASVARVLADMTADYATNPRHTAPRLDSVDASLYPFVNTNAVDVSRGHHDAGDYSKYTIDSAGLIHHLVFAVDAFPGVGSLDNLGLPESGDGRSDLLQEAKWEADFLVQMQDADGGFYFLVYPRDRKYESDVLPDHGDPQVVFPKNTSATAAATAALAQIASSPLFRTQFPVESARYLAAARRGWAFLQAAIATYGRDGSYQKISHYGDVFMHDDELVWAAAELFAATGEVGFEAELKSHFDPNSRDTRRWTWWRLFEGYGAAVRSYAFAARSGRLPAAALDPVYLAKCEAEIVACAADLQRWGGQSAYGTSFPDASKRQRSAGWYFSAPRAFDLAVAYQIQARPEWLGTLVGQVDYEAGANPLNVSFLTGLGIQRPTVLISQYAMNDRRAVPPSGFPIGQLQTGFAWLDLYQRELGSLCVPGDGAATNAYPLYDRWGDTWNTATEAVVVDQARGLGTLAFLMARTPLRTQPWQARAASIALVAGAAPGTWAATLVASNCDLGPATIVWETADRVLAGGTNLTLTIARTGEQWVEAEAQLPDGCRVFAANRFLAARAPDPTLPTVTVTAPDPKACRSPADPGRFEILRGGDLTQPLTVTYAIGGTARNGTDYGWINGSQYNVTIGTVTLPAGAERASLIVNPRSSSALTNDSTVVITVSAKAGYNVGLPYQATATIQLHPTVNHPPTAQNLEAHLADALGVSITLAGSDPDSDPLEYVILTPPAGGTLTGQPPNLVYLPGPEFNGTDQFTYFVRDAEFASALATVTLTRDFSSSVCVYAFNDDFADGLGNMPGLTACGLARLDRGALRLDLLDDAVVTLLPATAVTVDDSTREVAIDVRIFAEGYLSYGKTTAPLLRLYRNWNAFLELRQDKWGRSPMVRGGAITVVSAADLAPALTPNQWHLISLRLTPDAYRVFVDGLQVSSVPSTDLRNWRLKGPLALEAGHFAGWLDWLEVRVTRAPAAP